MTNVDLLVNSSNHKSMFPEYSKNIPRISVSKIFQACPRNILRLRKYFYEVRKFKELFCGLSCGIFNIGSLLFWNVFLNIIENFFHLVMFWKGLYRCLTAGKKIKISTTLLSIHNGIVIIVNLFRRVFNVSFRAAKSLCNCMCFWHHTIWHVFSKIFKLFLKVQ